MERTEAINLMNELRLLAATMRTGDVLPRDSSTCDSWWGERRFGGRGE